MIQNDAIYDLTANNEQGKNPPATWNQYTLVEEVDLNAKTVYGPYIYLHQSKTKTDFNKYHIMDIKAVDED